MKNFEKIQLDILNATNKNQLVSAGAGSGKTTVMIEKIANLLIKDKVPVENLLVVTFTVLAAEEMKERLQAKLVSELNISEDKDAILALIEDIKTASIDTIDGFSSKTIKKYFYELNISPNIEIITDATRDYYLSKAMKKTLDDYSKDSEKINMLIDIFGGNRRNLENIKSMVLSCYLNVINIEDYEKFLDDSVNEYIDSIKSEAVVNKYISNYIDRLKRTIRDNYSSVQVDIQEKLKNYLNILDIFNINLSLKTNLMNLEKINISSFSIKEVKNNQELKEINELINEFNDLKKDLKNNGIDENFDKINEKIIIYFKYFIEILKKFINNYTKLKEKNNLIDFNDLNRLMLKLLDNENIRQELNQKYKYIFIDEYQDVNPLQDSLMSKLVDKDTSLFTVGDVKQSIYGFRGASPEWFLNKYNNYKKKVDQGKAFDMNINFRSNPKVLNFVNEIFSKLMTKETADIDYLHDCMIDAKRTDIVDDKVKIMLCCDKGEDNIASGIYSVKNSPRDENVTSKDLESYLVVKTITELIGSSFYDANLKQNRTLTYSDIAILTHSQKDENSLILIDMLKQAGIPVNVTNSVDVENSETIKLILSILKCVIHEADDVDYLATFMAMTDMDINDVVKIRDKNKSLYENLIENLDEIKISSGFKLLEDIQAKSYVSSNRDLIRYILNDCKLKYYVLRMENGTKELNLVEEFLNKISPVEDNLGLAEFIDMIESNISKGSDFLNVDREDSVVFQTIHKSKGLEYPVVILYNSSKMFSYLRENDSITFNADLGLGVDYFDLANRTKQEGLVKYAIKKKNALKGYKEELRLLYVAMTRAKNKLIITGQYSNGLFKDKKIKNTNFMNMILSCFQNLEEGTNERENCIIDFVDVDLAKPLKKEHYNRQVEELYTNFDYSNSDKFSIPLKNTVTGLNSELSQQNRFEAKKWLNPTMQYDVQEDRALIGTHYHMALEQLDFSKEYEKNTEFDDVDYAKIKRAHDVISKLAKGCVNIKKEADFMMYVPYNKIVSGDIDDKILIQGVCDLIIEYEDSITIVDYKFSHLSIESLKQKYQEQLNIYKMAVESAYGKKVEHVFIYSINTGELG